MRKPPLRSATLIFFLCLVSKTALCDSSSATRAAKRPGSSVGTAAVVVVGFSVTAENRLTASLARETASRARSTPARSSSKTSASSFFSVFIRLPAATYRFSPRPRAQCPSPHSDKCFFFLLLSARDGARSAPDIASTREKKCCLRPALSL